MSKHEQTYKAKDTYTVNEKEKETETYKEYEKDSDHN